MSDQELTRQVKSVLAREWNLDADTIPEGATMNDYGPWDSLGHISIVLALESEFGIEVTAETLQQLVSVPKIVAYLTGLNAARQSGL